MGHVAKWVGQREEVCAGAYTIGKPRGRRKSGHMKQAYYIKS